MPRRVTRSEAGASLIEIVMALGILATVLMALGGLMFQVARHTQRSAAVAYRSAAAGNAATWVQGLPWDSLDSAVGCTTDSTGPMPYTQCVANSDLSANLKRVTVVISPTGVVAALPDTVVIDRNKPRPASPLRVQ
jgi:Tfp pilus assembly protein PilV